MALQLRYLQTLTDIATEKNSTIVFPLPMEMMSLFNKIAAKVGGPVVETPAEKKPVNEG
jgi:hypothetical protein